MVFTLRTGLDFLFQPPRSEEYDFVNIMVVGTSNSKIQLSIYDSFAIGTFRCPSQSPSGTAQLLQHTSHLKVSTQALLVSENLSNPHSIQIVPMDLPFISFSPINLSLLTSKLTTMQKLLRYLKQTQLHMQVEWKNARELPARFLKSVHGGLEEMESGPRTIIPALYHTVVTGHAQGPIREWLVDIVAERVGELTRKSYQSGGLTRLLSRATNAGTRL